MNPGSASTYQAPPPQPTRLVLIRHGEVEESYHRVFGGRIDMDLSRRGLDQAEHTSRYLEKLVPHALYVSPMVRARKTAEPAASRTRLTPIVVPDLREVDFGAWTGLKWEEIHERYRVTAYDWLLQMEQGLIPGGESAQSFRDRLAPVLERVLAESRGRTAAVICHGGVIRALLSLLLDLPLSKTAHFEIDYASVTIVDLRTGKHEIQLLNYTPWRETP